MANQKYGWGRKPPPIIRGRTVELESMRQEGSNIWVVTVRINNWPHDLLMTGQDELAIMQQIFQMQRGETPDLVFDISK